MIDTHIHILPGIDDGAASTDTSISMAEVAVNDGINSLICTPHDLNSVYQNSREKILERVSHLRDSLQQRQIALSIHPGAELHIDIDLPGKLLEGEAMTLADNNKHVLIEFPKHQIPYGSESILENLLYNHYTPVVAHPERNPSLASRPGLLKEWVGWGCKAQLTAMSVTGEFGSKLQSISRRWCHEGLIHVVASDAHRTTGRAPVLSKAYETLSGWLGKDAADLLTVKNPQNIINGVELDNLPVTQAPGLKKSRKSIFQFMRQRA